MQTLIGKRKKSLVKKAHELAKSGTLNVVVVVHDARLNILQEFCSSSAMDIAKAHAHIQAHPELRISEQEFRGTKRVAYPKKNFIE